MNRYYPPVMEIVELTEVDVITGSTQFGENETGAW